MKSHISPGGTGRGGVGSAEMPNVMPMPRTVDGIIARADDLATRRGQHEPRSEEELDVGIKPDC